MSVAGFEVGDGASASFDAAPAVNASTVPLARVTRRLAVINVQPGAGTLQAALNAVSAGDELVLADGTYTGSGTNVLEIGKSITIRALNLRGAILDGQNARRGVYITSGTVVLEGLGITRGYAYGAATTVSASVPRTVVSNAAAPRWITTDLPRVTLSLLAGSRAHPAATVEQTVPLIYRS